MRKQLLEKIRAVRKTVEELDKDLKKLKDDPALNGEDKREARAAYYALCRAGIELQEVEEAFEYLV